MNAYEHRCSGCQVCPACERTAWCEGDRILSIPCEHKGYCGDCNLTECGPCRVAEGLERAFAYRDPFRVEGVEDPDPWGTNPAEPHKPYNAAYHQAYRREQA